MDMTELERRLQAQLLAGQRIEGDRLVLDDAVLRAALDGSRPLRPAERAALQGSPLTLRRFRRLAGEARAAWQGSRGLLRAADSGAALELLATDDGMWRLHFAGAQVILQLDLQAARAARLLAGHESMKVMVKDGAGSLVLEGVLDADGECEGPWPFAAPPAQHFQRHGAVFTVEPAREGL
ncbi:hypothetical protein [Massilia sp. ST3]|uniref:hypothetical protein n=1 Tax=Massilia sp. ST3 TaxID=2824903 RepID=UPI001B81853E|nr:hypothetical protein [Massilia sp. ST3]MBQ5949891.1 hypothetical protein [Massilia sp. ST3]